MSFLARWVEVVMVVGGGREGRREDATLTAGDVPNREVFTGVVELGQPTVIAVDIN